MGGLMSCCKFSDKNNQPTSYSVSKIKSPSQLEVITSQPVADEKPTTVSAVEINFPQYSVISSSSTKQEAAAVITFQNGSSLGAMGDSSSIMNLYNKYVDPDLGMIGAEGIERLCNDLEISPEDFRILVLAYCLGAQVMCRFTEDEFVSGCKKHGITDISSMKASVPNLLNCVKGPSFAPFYRWTYKFALDLESGQRTLPTDMALSLWKLVFYQNYPPILDRWLHFIESNTSIKGISKDTWDMFLIFIDQIGEDLDSYDDTEAWPSLLDDFVETEKEKCVAVNV